MNKLKKIVLPTDVSEQGLLYDLLWSDPDPDERAKEGFRENDRGVSIIFNGDIIKILFKNNNLDLIVRAHQVIEEGYEFSNENNCLQYLAIQIIMVNLIMLEQ